MRARCPKHVAVGVDVECVLSTCRSRVSACSARSDTPTPAYEDRNLSELKGRVKVFAQCAISVAPSVRAGYLEVSFTEQARGRKQRRRGRMDRALPHVLHQVSTSAQEFPCHVGRVSSSSCSQSSRMQNGTERVCLRVRAEKSVGPFDGTGPSRSGKIGAVSPRFGRAVSSSRERSENNHFFQLLVFPRQSGPRYTT